jgi:hypothetical protein
MNALNALLFALVGAAMEILPAALPSMFPRACADQASTRALWLGFMGTLQIGLGVGYIVRTHAVPFLARLIATAPAGELESTALPAARGMAGR